MSVPTYTRIDATEVDSESPITASLMGRLKNNVLALLGVDEAATSPVVGLGIRGEAFIRNSGVTAVGITVSGAGPYTFTIPTGVSKMLVQAIGNGGDGSSTVGGLAGAYVEKLVAVTPGETITVTVPAQSSASAVTVVGSVTGSIASLAKGAAGAGDMAYMQSLDMSLTRYYHGGDGEPNLFGRSALGGNGSGPGNGANGTDGGGGGGGGLVVDSSGSTLGTGTAGTGGPAVVRLII